LAILYSCVSMELLEMWSAVFRCQVCPSLFLGHSSDGKKRQTWRRTVYIRSLSGSENRCGSGRDFRYPHSGRLLGENVPHISLSEYSDTYNNNKWVCGAKEANVNAKRQHFRQEQDSQEPLMTKIPFVTKRLMRGRGGSWKSGSGVRKELSGY
jgi:hypothetical protein